MPVFGQGFSDPWHHRSWARLSSQLVAAVAAGRTWALCEFGLLDGRHGFHLELWLPTRSSLSRPLPLLPLAPTTR